MRLKLINQIEKQIWGREFWLGKYNIGNYNYFSIAFEATDESRLTILQ